MFWDTSAIIPVVFQEAQSQAVRALLDADAEPAVWWLTAVECSSALYRRYRQHQVSPQQLNTALAWFTAFHSSVDTVQPAATVRQRAETAVAAHDLGAADAVQLAAALTWCRGQTHGQTFVCLDLRLREAAAREGFTVVP